MGFFVKIVYFQLSQKRKHKRCKFNGKLGFIEKVFPIFANPKLLSKFPYIYAIDEIRGFKFGLQLDFVKVHHTIVPKMLAWL